MTLPAMTFKELIEQRWKFIGGLALGLIGIVAGLAVQNLLKSQLTPDTLNGVPQVMKDQFTLIASSFDAYAWSNAFNPSNGFGVIFLIVAALLGASSLAGEVARGTIFTLLARPVSRARILGVKLGVNAGLLLALALAAALTNWLVSAILGHPQHLGGELVSAVNLWLGGAFILGVATLASSMFNDTLRPLAISLVVAILLGLPAFNPDWAAWSLPHYWTSLPAFLGHEFPLKNLLVSALAAAIPTLLTLPVFNARRY